VIRAPRMRLDATWRHAERTLVVLEARSASKDDRLHLAIEASVLPGSAGRREIAGALRARDWRGIPNGEMEDGRLELDVPDVDAALADLRRLLAYADIPGDAMPAALRGDTIPARLRTGRLIAAVRASGQVAGPDLDVNASWRPGPDEHARLTARGRPVEEPPFLDGPGRVELELTRLDLSRFPTPPVPGGDGAGLQGRIDATIRMNGAPGDFLAELDLEGTDIRYGERPGLARLRLDCAEEGVVPDQVEGRLGLPVEEVRVQHRRVLRRDAGLRAQRLETGQGAGGDLEAGDGALRGREGENVVAAAAAGHERPSRGQGA